MGERKINLPLGPLTVTDNIKDKGRILKASSDKKQITHKGIRIRLHLVFILRNLTSRGQWSIMFLKC